MMSYFKNKNLLNFSFSFWVGSFSVLIGFLLAILSFFWTPYDVTSLEISNRFKTPSSHNFLGTDHFGRDILSMIMVGAQTSIAVAFVAVGIGILFGLPLGLIAAGKRGTFFDDLVMRFNDLIFAFPALIIAILITAVLGPGAFNAIIAIGIFNIPVFARVARGAALTQWSKEYILAAQVSGKGAVLISIEHIIIGLSKDSRCCKKILNDKQIYEDVLFKVVNEINESILHKVEYKFTTLKDSHKCIL